MSSGAVASSIGTAAVELTIERMSVRWWVRDKLEPLTARRVAAVEGISDRIILERCADATDRNLDRLGCALVETNGAGDMGAIIKLFGAFPPSSHGSNDTWSRATRP